MSELHLLGTGGYHPSDTRHTACFMLPEDGVILDAGTSFFRVRDRIATSSINIFLTHVHLDHCQGLTYINDVLRGKGIERITVHGKQTHLNAVGEKLFDQYLFPVPFEHELRPIAQETTVGDWTIRWMLQPDHPGTSLAYRFDGPATSFAYVSDTNADPDNEEKVAFVRGVKLMLHECYFTDGFEEAATTTGHSCSSAVGAFARNAGIDHLLLIHPSPVVGQDILTTIERQVSAFVPDTRYANDLEVVEF
ncbi:ribonuclease Z [Planctomycetes bacterium Pan216]|uniref:Ribonuclease Z n=1 Tax=Kolteria novifilia TaxID=2527975 RepID=A0A518B7V3_9BACT|nr:ribonuclease Z [Planctomycetes bacterium Pan216]